MVFGFEDEEDSLVGDDFRFGVDEDEEEEDDGADAALPLPLSFAEDEAILGAMSLCELRSCSMMYESIMKVQREPCC